MDAGAAQREQPRPMYAQIVFVGQAGMESVRRQKGTDYLGLGKVHVAIQHNQRHQAVPSAKGICVKISDRINVISVFGNGCLSPFAAGCPGRHH